IGIDGAPETMLAPSSKPRATCSTTWLGDHFPGARGVVQVAADLSAAATRSRTAARLAASTSFKSAMRPPVRESVIDLNEPADDSVHRARDVPRKSIAKPLRALLSNSSASTL